MVLAPACAALGYLSIVGVGDSNVADRTRIAAQVVTGIGLFGAAAIGLCVGMGATLLGGALSGFTLLFLSPVDWIFDHLFADRFLDQRSLHFVAIGIPVASAIEDVLCRYGAEVRSFTIIRLDGAVDLRLVLRCRPQRRYALTDRRGSRAVRRPP